MESQPENPSHKNEKNFPSKSLPPNNISNINSPLDDTTFPCRIIGNIEKKHIFSNYSTYYLEIDCIKGKLNIYSSLSNFPSNPSESYDIYLLKSLLKTKQDSEHYAFKIEILPKQTISLQVLHLCSRNQWFKAISKVFSHFKKGKPLPPFNTSTLFIDDLLGTNHFIHKPSLSISTEFFKPTSISISDFQISSLLGYGAFSTVYQVTYIKTGKTYAMKVFDKNIIISKKHLQHVITEFNILQKMKCPFILKLYCAFQSANYLYLVIDFCAQGDITKIESISNRKLLYAELILAFEYLHKNNIIYRDIKPENILLTEDGHVKLCDFNLAEEGVDKEGRKYSFCGSSLYLSPEMLKEEGVGHSADVFGIGLIIYEVETNVPAFYANNIEEMYEKIENVDIDFMKLVKDGKCVDLLTKVLIMEEELRLGIKEMKNHVFFEKVNWKHVLEKKCGKIYIKKRKDGKRNSCWKHEEREEKQAMKIKKIKRKEIIRDKERPMSNYIVNFYYIGDGFQCEDDINFKEDTTEDEDIE